MQSLENVYLTITDQFSIKRKITIQEAEVLFNIKWIEWDKNNLDILNFVEIKYMGQTLGWGLFCQKRIEINTVIGIFTGEIRYQSRDNLINSSHIFLSDVDNYQYQVIDATFSGNATRFLQHLPSDEVINTILADTEIFSKVATANIKKNLFKLQGSVLTEQYITTAVIEEGDIIGCCYDPLFWIEKKPSLFYKNGSIIPSEFYKWPEDNIKKEHLPRRFI